MKRSLAFFLFFLSFAPLWISVMLEEIIGLRIPEPHGTEWCVLVAIPILTIVSLGVLKSQEKEWQEMAQSEQDGLNTFEICDVISKRTISSEFLLSYVLPLVAFDFTKWLSFVQFLVFFATLAYLNCKYLTVSPNIVLEIRKYRHFECSIKQKCETKARTIAVLSRRDLRHLSGDTVLLPEINDLLRIDIESLSSR